GAPANDLAAPVPEEVKLERHRRFMEKQEEISANKLKAKIGRRLEVIIDEADDGGAEGRTRGDAPEIDGLVHIRTRKKLAAGDIVTVEVEDADEHDLFAVA